MLSAVNYLGPTKGQTMFYGFKQTHSCRLRLEIINFKNFQRWGVLPALLKVCYLEPAGFV